MAESANEESKKLGVTVSLDYFSNYLWRGTKFYNGDGAFLPSISWTLFDTGFSLGIISEISQSYIFNGFQKKPNKYYPALDSAGGLTFYKKNLKINNLAYASHSLDFGVEYSNTLKDSILIEASVWYWWYYNSKNSRFYARPTVEGLNQWSYYDASFITATIGIGFQKVPFVNPYISVSYDNYISLNSKGDFYISLNFSRSIELMKNATVTLGLSGGYYYNQATSYTRYYLSYSYNAGSGLYEPVSFNVTGNPIITTANGITRYRVPVKKGVSDISPNISLAIIKDNITITGSFSWVIVPSLTWHKNDDIHRYYAKLGVSYTL
jgi:hypothetical protein